MIQTLFRADLLVEKNVGTVQQREILKNQILEIKKNSSESTSHSNDLCWRKNNIDVPEWLRLDLDNLIKKCYNLYQDDDVFRRLNKNTYKLVVWANVNAPGSRNTMHSHPTAHLSSVYYLQAKNTGNLRLLNPSNILGFCNFSSPFIRDFEFSPSDGDLIIWPSWVPHEVETNFSNLPRVNLVFDIIFDVE